MLSTVTYFKTIFEMLSLLTSCAAIYVFRPLHVVHGALSAVCDTFFFYV